MSMKVLVTGSSGAFGSLTCKSLAQIGYEVVGTMRSKDGKNKAVSQELEMAGVKLVEMDVTNEASVNSAVAQSIEIMGGLDVVFNNAGLGANGIQEMFTAEDMQHVFDVNVFGVQRLMRAILPHFRKQRKGTILHTSSCIGRVTTPFLGVYCASKYALESIAEGYRAELSGFGIESCIIEPGGMPTAFMGGMLQPSDKTRNKEYGEMVHAPDASLNGYIEYIKTNPNQSPQAVADAVIALLKMPHGEKPFRTVVDFMGLKDPIENYNEALLLATQQIYAANGVENLLALNKS